MKHLRPVIFSALAALSTFAQAAGGAYSGTAVGATIFSPGVYYTTSFPVLGSPPASSTIGPSVSWNYSLDPIPAGRTLTALLCHGVSKANSYCINVTNAKSGTTNAFNGRSAATKFFLYYGVTGPSGFVPIYGGSDQVIVNWN